MFTTTLFFFIRRIHTKVFLITFYRDENLSCGRLLMSKVFERKADYLFSQQLLKKL